mmetsp:Transcript_57397/g.136429  ORF Transcript_57397/g.136429 Transcript_57397/m.136429 type:complete len:431 (+) Transcript_57397:103-1395(+)
MPASSVRIALAYYMLLQAFLQHAVALQVGTRAGSGETLALDAAVNLGCPGIEEQRNLWPALALLNFARQFEQKAHKPSWIRPFDVSLLGREGSQATVDEIDAMFDGHIMSAHRTMNLSLFGMSAGLNHSELPPSVEQPAELNKEQYEWAKSLEGPVWVFSAYHKTGTALSWKILHGMKQDSSPLNKVHATICDGGRRIFHNDEWSNAYDWPVIDVVRVLPNYRLVHFIRDPVNLIMSAFRYHQSGIENWSFTKNLLQAARKELAFDSLLALQQLRKDFHLTSKQKLALSHFRKAARHGMSLVDFYRSAPEHQGVTVEAFRSWPMLVLLMHNYELTRQDPNSLQMRMESQQKDFEASMRCMFSFLGESRQINLQEALAIVAPLDVTKHPQLARKHLTHGRYDNSKLQSVLENMAPIMAARRKMHEPALREC